MTDYSQMTDEEFAERLFNDIKNLSPSKLLGTASLNEVVTEHPPETTTATRENSNE